LWSTNKGEVVSLVKEKYDKEMISFLA
jgi:hypothetical protein